MRSALTYRSALAIMGKREHAIIARLDQLLGAAILGAAPLRAQAIFNMVDQKNEGIALLRSLADKVADHFSGVTGRERHELIRAANGVLLITSFFEAMAELIPKWESLQMTDEEKLARAGRAYTKVKAKATIPAQLLSNGLNSGTLQGILDIEFPEPWAGRGFEEALGLEVKPFLRSMVTDCLVFFAGLEQWENIAGRDHSLRSRLEARVADRAVQKYRDYSMRLAADVAEFQIWISLGESFAIRSLFRNSLSDILESQSRAFSKLEALLGLAPDQSKDSPTVAPPRAQTPTNDSVGALVNRINTAELSKPILATDTVSFASFLAFPSVQEGYITPNFRYVSQAIGSRPAEEAWWADQRVRDDLDELLAAHLAAPASANHPLLVLGHPGAGKSMLTRVLAARLPSERYTSVWVPLRHVNVNKPLYQQISQALEESTHGRATWNSLAEHTAEKTVRVVFLDGLDELVQASGVSQSRYLYEIIDFQNQERVVSGRPVVVIVTSRTVVADRVEIPRGTPIIKLEDFSEGQVEDWLQRWNTANRAVPQFKALEPKAALDLGEICRQPLLLLMLALYAADPETTTLSALRSSADLYSALIENFIRRELFKSSVRGSQPAVDGGLQVGYRRRNLSLAAFAMFNRGRQFVTHSELKNDLDAYLGGRPVDRADFDEPVDQAAATVGQFFFVHAPKGEGSNDARLGLQRSYEFLHATFGEYLIASELLELIEMLARSQADDYYNPSPYQRQFDDGVLRSLLSHQPLTKRPTTLVFFGELFRAKDENVRQWVVRALGLAIKRARDPVSYNRSSSNPSGGDAIHHIAMYSANLCALIATTSNDGVDISTIAPDGADATAWWRGMVRLWRSASDDEGWSSIIRSVFVAPEYRDGTFDWRGPATRLYWMRPNAYPSGMGSFFAELDASEAEPYLLGDRQLAAWVTSGRISWWRESQVSGPGARAHHLLLGMRNIAKDQWDGLYEEIGNAAYDGLMSAATIDLLSVSLARDAYYLSEQNLARCIEALRMRKALGLAVLAKCVAAMPSLAARYASSRLLGRGIRFTGEDRATYRETMTICSGILAETNDPVVTEFVHDLMELLQVEVPST